MNHKFYRFSFFLMALLLSLASCSELKSLMNPDEDPDEPGDDPIEVNMVSYSLSGIVKDVNGTPLEGVLVTSGTASSTTNTEGLFDLSEQAMVERRSLVRFSKDGYFDVVRSAPIAYDDTWNVVMCKKANNDYTSIKTFNASTAQTLTAGGMTIDLPKNAYRIDGDDDTYSGKVKTEMVYLDPNHDSFAEMMPGGDLAAVRSDNSRVALLSYGMADLNMFGNNGEKLQLRKGVKAQLTFPIPTGMESNRPASIPLWSFNEKTGLWEEEGSATLQGDVYVGEVSHFSWVNLDWPENQGLVMGYVKDTDGNRLPGVRVNVGQVVSSVTDDNGYYSQVVPANTDFSITVKPKNYGGYNKVVKVDVPALTPGEQRQVDIVLPRLVRVYGKVIDGESQGMRASVWVETSKTCTESVQTDKDGQFSIYVPEGMKGDAVVKARSQSGQEASEQITIRKEDVCVLLKMKGNGGASENKIHIYSDALGDVDWPVPTTNGAQNVVCVVDGTLLLVPGDEQHVNMGMQVSNYNKDQTKYDQGVGVMVENMVTGGSFYSEDGKDMECTVDKTDDAFVIALSGYGTFYSKQQGMSDENAKIVAKNMKFNHLFTGKTLRNVMPRDAGFPSFTPQLDVKAPLAMNITESPHLGKGGMIYYNGDEADYKTLRAAAAKLGLDKMGEDNEAGYMEVIYYSAKKQTLVMIEYDAGSSPIDEDATWEDADAPIMVTVLDGISEDWLELMFGDDDTRSRANNKTVANKLRYLGKMNRVGRK